MPTPKLPLKPKYGRYGLTEAEMKCIRNVVAFGEKPNEMYAVFVRPDLATSPALQKKYSDQFFNTTDARNFMADYSRLLDGVEPIPSAVQGVVIEEVDREKRKTSAVEKFTDKVVDKMSGDLETVEEMDAIAKLADRVGVLSEKEEVQEKPRRYLPESCSRCTYKAFVEENIKKGNIIDDENT